jgi:hypothetical protein
VLDGCLAPWQAAAPLRLDELTTFHTDIPGSPTLSIAVSMLVMNKARFESMLGRTPAHPPGEERPARRHHGGRAFDASNAKVLAAVQERGHAISRSRRRKRAAG